MKANEYFYRLELKAWFYACFYLSIGCAQNPPNITNDGEARSVEIICVDPNAATNYSKDTSECIPPINNTIEPATQAINLSICGPQLYGKILTESGDGVEDVEIRADPPTSPSSPCLACMSPGCTPAYTVAVSAQDGGYGFCSLCARCTHFLVTPSYDENPLNGITTYDLVLISKHILGSTPLGSLYKMIAADANNSGSITTFDIVTIRKILLGIDTAFSNNTSWRFVDAAFSFPNPANPWTSVFPESINCVDPNDNNSIDFIGIKIGDVNNTVVAHSRPAERPVATLSCGDSGKRSGNIITIPVMYTGSVPLEAFQLGIRFDPAKLTLIGPSKGDLPGYTADNFGLTRVNEGEIRTLWLPMTDEFEKIMPGQTLFYLTFKVLTGSALSGSLLSFDDRILANAAWQSDGKEYAIQVSPAIQERTPFTGNNLNAVQASVQPNPVSGTATLTVITSQAMKGRFGLYEAFGRRVLLNNIEFAAGRQTIELPETANLPAGVYFWKVSGPDGQVQGHLIKQ